MILVIANIFIFVKTNSRLSFGLSILTLCLVLVFQYAPKLLKNNKIVHMGMKLSFVLSASASFICTLLYSEHNFLMQKLNVFWGNRLYFGKRSISLYGVSLFGNSNIEWIGNGLDKNGMASVGEKLYVDSLYIQVMQKFGIIFVVVALVLLTLAMFQIVEQKKYILAFILTMIAIHCMIDDLFMGISYNPFWFAIGIVLMGKKRISNSSRSCE